MMHHDVHGLARAVGKQLEGWSYGRNEHLYEHAAYLLHAETGAELVLETHRWPPHRSDRLDVKGRYPGIPQWGEAHTSAYYWGVVRDPTQEPRITVLATRPAEEIAGEIRRRFEPAYWPVWRQISQLHTDAVLDIERCESLLGEMLSMFADGRRMHGRDHVGVIYGDGWDARVHVSGGPLGQKPSVDVRLSLPADVALDVMRLVATKKGRRDG